MTLQQLRLFSAIAKHGNVTKAARELRVSQPAVTYQLKLFQEEFGRLYDRTAQGIRLTTPGRLLLRDADDVLSRADGMTAKFGVAKARGGRALLVIGGSNGPGASLLPMAAAPRDASRRGDRPALRDQPGARGDGEERRDRDRRRDLAYALARPGL